MKKVLTIFCLFFGITLLAASSHNDVKEVDNEKIGISMPRSDQIRWKKDGLSLKEKLIEAGYDVYLEYAENKAEIQILQVEKMISQNCKVLIIAPVDGYALSNVLKSAKTKNIKVISYDRLILNSDAVSYYITFDKYRAGEVQAEYIIKKLKIDSRTKKNPVYMEFFTGDIRDNNVPFFFYGAMNVFSPYIKQGIIVCPSGETTIYQCATSEWRVINAQKRMEKLITENKYGPKGKKLDAVCCSNDSTAIGVTNALLAAGYSEKNFPIITGQDCDIISVRNIIKKTQSMSVFLDTKTLIEDTVKMADAIMQGNSPLINNTKTYDNGTGIIPSYLCEPSVVTKENYEKLLLEPEYYTKEDLIILDDYSSLVGNIVYVDNNWAGSCYVFKEKKKNDFIIEEIVFGSGVDIAGRKEFTCKEKKRIINLDKSRKFVLKDGLLSFYYDGKEQQIIEISAWDK
ncbi:MAG: sugar-binding protein [Treponema sp.]|nr:sugar-binding protein [Treponema sp.]